MTRWSIPLPSSQNKPQLVRALARAFSTAEAREQAIVARAAYTLGREWRWLRPVARRFLQRFSQDARPRKRDVVEFLLGDPAFQRAWKKRDLRIAHQVLQHASAPPAGKTASWNLPAIPDVSTLAAWLRLTPGELDWFADLKGMLAKRADARLRHYSYRAIEKRSGGLRLLEAPKQHLRAIQRQLLREILENIPVHPAANGFVKGRSIRTYAAPHAGRAVVVRMDLRDFFPVFTRARVQALFRMAAYPEAVADRLGGLCTTIAPRAVLRERGLDHDAWCLYGRPHLPQGAPTSPALANACAWRLDCRLDGLARSSGAVYTRYADDLAFSGDDDFARRAERFAAAAAAIAIDEGFAVHFRKTRVMRQSVRQHLAGLVTNQRLNVLRADYDRLKAVLTNCVRHGAHSQNREGLPQFRAHLQGRVSFVESVNAARGARLRSLFDRIAWE